MDDYYQSKRIVLLLLTLAMAGIANSAFAQGTAFTYQGRLQDGGTNANGSYDFQFTLWDALNGGTQQPQAAPVTVTKSNVVVTNGVFTTQLDFGAAAFSGADRFLETSVRLSGATSFTLLSPRQPITSTPYAVRSASSNNADVAATATNAAQLGGIVANQYVITTDSRLTDPRAPIAGSSNYIQNTTTQQASSTFNVSGNGTAGGTLSANAVNATQQYNLKSLRAFSISGGSNQFQNSNTFVGVEAGTSTNPSPTSSLGNFNSFLGTSAGHQNTGGGENSFFGAYTGFANTTGQGNSFFGDFAGNSNTTGANNAFFGSGAGFSNTTASLNSFFGQQSGNSNTTGTYNSFFGQATGIANISGGLNSFFGTNAGTGNTTGSLNSFFGALSGNGSNGSQNSFFGSSSGFSNSTGNDNSYFGYWTGHNTSGNGNSFVGSLAGGSTTSGNYNSFFGFSAGGGNLTGTSNTLLGDNANVGASNLSNATAIGSHAFVSANNSLVLGSVNGVNGATASTNVAIGTTSPIGRLNVVGSAGPTQGIQIDNREIKFRGDGFAHFSIFANRVPGTLTIEDTSSSFAMNTAGTLGLSIASGSGNVGIGTNGPAAALEVHRNGTISSDWQTGQLRISGASDPNMQLSLGYDTSSNMGAIQAGQAFTGFKPLRLNPFGGEVAIGSVVPTTSENLIVGSARVVTGLFLGVVSGGGTSQLCLDGSGKVTLCSSSVRYKANIRDFSPGLGLIQQLKPIRFEWKGSGDSDFGLVAEDVEKINPLLVTYNNNRQIEGVKYDRIGVVLVNAVKEQQAQIESQQALIQQQEQRARDQQTMLATQQRQIGALKKLVCQTHRRAAVCR